MTQKRSSDWYIATTHYLTAGLAIQFIANLVIRVIFNFGAPLLRFIPVLLLAVFTLAVRLLFVWFGVRYSANYLEKAYIIENKDKIINLSTIYFVVLHLGYVLILVLNYDGYDNKKIIWIALEVIITIVLFYISSKKYVRNTEARTV